jgi:hypothetical protein
MNMFFESLICKCWYIVFAIHEIFCVIDFVESCNHKFIFNVQNGNQTFFSFHLFYSPQFSLQHFTLSLLHYFFNQFLKPSSKPTTIKIKECFSKLSQENKLSISSQHLVNIPKQYK